MTWAFVVILTLANGNPYISGMKGLQSEAKCHAMAAAAIKAAKLPDGSSYSCYQEPK